MEQQDFILIKFKHIRKIESEKDLKNYKKIPDLKKYEESYLQAIIQKIELLVQLSEFHGDFYLLDQPLIKNNQNIVVYLYSFQSSIKQSIPYYNHKQFGKRIADSLKHIIKSLYYEQDCHQSEGFQKFADFIIDQCQNDHFEQIKSTDKQLVQQIWRSLKKMRFFYNNSLNLKIKDSLLLKKLNKVIQKNENNRVSSEIYLKLFDDYRQILKKKKQSIEKAEEQILDLFLVFLKHCSSDNILEYPIRNLSQELQILSQQSQESNKFGTKHIFFNIDIVAFQSKQIKSNIEQNLINEYSEVSQQECTQNQVNFLMKVFSFQNNALKTSERIIQIKFFTKFKIHGGCFLILSSFFKEVMQKYTFLCQKQPTNKYGDPLTLNHVQLQIHTQEQYLQLTYELHLLSKQSLILEFIGAVDKLILVYLIMEKLFIKIYENSPFMIGLFQNLNKTQRELKIKEYAQESYTQMTYYLQKYWNFKTKNQL